MLQWFPCQPCGPDSPSNHPPLKNKTLHCDLPWRAPPTFLCSPESTESKRARGRPVPNRGCHPAAPRAWPSKQKRSGAALHGRASIRQKISRLIGSSRSAVLDALSRFGIPPSEGRRKRTGTLPFGFDYLNHQLVKNGAEQAAIRMMRQYRAGGLSLREIAGDLNLNLIPTKESTQNKRYSLMVRQKDCRRFRNPCGLDSEVFQSFRHQVQAAQVEKDRHPETFTIAKPTGHILNALNACVFRFGHRV